MKRIEVGMLCFLIAPAARAFRGRVVSIVGPLTDVPSYSWLVRAEWFKEFHATGGWASDDMLLPINTPDATDSERKPETVSA